MRAPPGLHVPLLLLPLLLLAAQQRYASAGPSQDGEDMDWDDDTLYQFDSYNLDGPDWNQRNLVPVQCVRMNGEEMMVYTLFDNDRHTYDVAPDDDDATDDVYNYNQDDAATDDYNDDDDAYANDATDDANNNYNNNYNNDDANAANDDAVNAKNYNYDYSAVTDDRYYDAYYNKNNANDDAAATDDATTDDATNDDGVTYSKYYWNNNNNNQNNGNRNRKLNNNGFSYNKDARCRTQRGTYYAPLADFVRAYTRQRAVNAMYMGNRNRVPAAVRYLTCTKYDSSYDNDQEHLRRILFGEEYQEEEEMRNPMSARRSLSEHDKENTDKDNANMIQRQLDEYVDYTRGKDVYIQVGCLPSTGKALTFHTYKDDQCKKPLDRWGDNSDSRAILSNVGASNINVHFGTCHHCVVWPERKEGDDDDASHHSREFQADDDLFWNTHGYDSPLCASVQMDANRHRCGIKCRVAMAERYNGYGHYTRGLTLAGKIVAWIMAASVAVAVFLIDRERKEKVSTEKDLLRHLFGGLRVDTLALCLVAGALLLFSVLLELMELKYAFWAVLSSVVVIFWMYWWSLYRVGPRKGLLDGQVGLAQNENAVMA